MERPTCEQPGCTRPADAFHVFRQLFMCGQHAVLVSTESAALMTLRCRTASFTCRVNKCGRPGRFKGVKNNDYVCATHSEGIPRHLLTDKLGEPSLSLTVEVSLGQVGTFDLIPVTETANALGRKGFRVFNLSWLDDLQESNRLLLHIEPFTGIFAQDALTKRQIALLEAENGKAQNALLVADCLANTNFNKYVQERDQNRDLRAQLSALKDESEQLRLKYQHVMANGREEELPMYDISELY